MNRYLAILIAALTSAEMQAFQLAPRIVVNITVDELRSDYIESFSPMFSSEGLRKLIEQGKMYEIASYPSNPIDRASAIATLATGATPFYHGIVAEQWLDRQTLRPVYCVDDEKRQTTANRLLTSTLGDELKISSQGKAVVYGIAATRDAAILSAGHAADNAFWIDERLHKCALTGRDSRTECKVSVCREIDRYGKLKLILRVVHHTDDRAEREFLIAELGILSVRVSLFHILNYRIIKKQLRKDRQPELEPVIEAVAV